MQRAHGKVRYEGMALPMSTVPQSQSTHFKGDKLTTIYTYNCTRPGASTEDLALGPANWTGRGQIDPKQETVPPCTVVRAEGYVWAANTTSAGDTLIPLEVWLKANSSWQDHYVVASEAGKADALAQNYSLLLQLGFVYPPPGAPNAPSRYALPSLSKDDPLYISQDYWRGRAWAPMNHLVYWGLALYNSSEVKAATDGA